MKTFKQYIKEEISYHPKKDEDGRKVEIYSPHQPTHHSTWDNPNEVATTTPNHNIQNESKKFGSWEHDPNHDWNKVEGQGNFEEPEVHNPSGKKLATGVIVHEDDGRVWVVHPTNEFGGYSATFPKGKVDPGLNLRANAIKEAHEESGLKVELTGHAGDVERSTSYTRYYHARRVGGHPSNMGWESQAVSLVPKHKLHEVVNHPNDAPLVRTVQKMA
jgi:8-oxo-dGTP pyrophosphatase MutT (NUDIX family)